MYVYIRFFFHFFLNSIISNTIGNNFFNDSLSLLQDKQSYIVILSQLSKERTTARISEPVRKWLIPPAIGRLYIPTRRYHVTLHYLVILGAHWIVCNSTRICIRRTTTTKNHGVANGAAITLAKRIGTSHEVNQRVRYRRKKESYEKRVMRSLCVMPLAYIYIAKLLQNYCKWL